MEKQPLLPTQEVEAGTTTEPSLAELQQNVRDAHRAYFRAWHRTTSGRLHKSIMFCVSMLMLFFALFCLGVIIDDYNSDDGASWPEPARRAKVPLEAHIMSKCPDAKDCLHDLILPAMQNVSDKVDFTLSYVGESTPYDGVKCMHGQTECLGNMIELCAAHLYPDPKIYLGFTMCLTRDYAEIPKRELVQDCALEHSISMEALNDCLNAEDGGKAVEMLRESFNRTADAGVTKSCTVRLNGEIRCVRDGGKWKECEGGHSPEELVSEIQELAATGLWS